MCVIKRSLQSAGSCSTVGAPIHSGRLKHKLHLFRFVEGLLYNTLYKTSTKYQKHKQVNPHVKTLYSLL